MDDKRQTTREDAEAEREKGAALEYDAQDEDAPEGDAPAAHGDEGARR